MQRRRRGLGEAGAARRGLREAGADRRGAAQRLRKGLREAGAAVGPMVGMTCLVPPHI